MEGDMRESLMLLARTMYRWAREDRAKYHKLRGSGSIETTTFLASGNAFRLAARLIVQRIR